ncbi:thiamine-phosphate kinase [Candidatus Woesearchaeota archaeon]|nr:thiamine-phosphate kinase [Candidatus Woesearchaeota archaeon]
MKPTHLGEFELIKHVTKAVRHPDVLIGIGDDCAVLKQKNDPNNYLLLTTDTLIEDVHFSFHWYTPEQVGKKAIEVNVSDIAAMGGRPLYALVAASFPQETNVKTIKRLMDGVYFSAEKHGIAIVGGNTTQSHALMITLTLVGEVHQKNLCLRSAAQEGDLLCITGTLGESAAGLAILQQYGLKTVKDKRWDVQQHLEPTARLREGQELARKGMHAMIDISDGLGSEIRHICTQSKVGAIIDKEKIPLSETTKQFAAILNKDAYTFALTGGEDYELLFTVEEHILGELQKTIKTPVTVIGKILPKSKGVHLLDGKKKIPLPKGWDHFS